MNNVFQLIFTLSHVSFTFFMQGAILYRVKGISPAPYFFDVDKSTGEITLRENLKLGKDLIYTVSIQIYKLLVLFNL